MKKKATRKTRTTVKTRAKTGRSKTVKVKTRPTVLRCMMTLPLPAARQRLAGIVGTTTLALAAASFGLRSPGFRKIRALP